MHNFNKEERIFFRGYIKQNPVKAEERYVFIIQSSAVANNLRASGFQALAVDADYPVDNLISDIEACLIGTYIKEHIYVLWLKKDDESRLWRIFKNEDIPHFNDGYQIFKGHPEYSLRDNRGDLEKAVGNYIKNRQPAKTMRPIIRSMSEYEEAEPEWVIPGWIPSKAISVIAGDGGAGKSTLVINIIASITKGSGSILEHFMPEFGNREGRPVLYFNAEDDINSVTKSRLRKAGADQSKVFVIGVDEEGFSEINLGNLGLLESYIEQVRPSLVIFDPLQSFLDKDVQMISRNAMRQALNPLIALGKKHNVGFLLVMHTNKLSNVWGRKRLSDSSDMWDIARSVMIVGDANKEGLRYISQEKSSYGAEQETVIFNIDESGARYESTSSKKDRDFVREAYTPKGELSVLDEVKAFIIQELASEDKDMESKTLHARCKDAGHSSATTRRALEELAKEKKIRRYNIGFGESKKYYVSRHCND